MTRFFKSFLFLGLAMGWSPLLFSQFKDSVSAKPLQKPLPVKVLPPRFPSKELSVGLKLNTDGWSIFIDKGNVKSDEQKNSDKFYDIRLFYIELTEKRHPKEIKQTNTNFAGNDKPKPYIYGKINNFYSMKLGYGLRKMIAGKPSQGAISIHWVYAGGLAIGFQKPYYLDTYTGAFSEESIRYEGDHKSDFLNQNNIIGSSGFSKGLGEMKIIPGLHGKTGLHFDFAASYKTKWALEIGIAADLYTSKVELMAEQKAVPYFFNAYVALLFGKRW